jgi:hypothetical protein
MHDGDGIIELALRGVPPNSEFAMFCLAEPREPRARAEEKQIRRLGWGEEVDGKKVRREAESGSTRDACFPFAEVSADQKSPKVNGKTVQRILVVCAGRARDCFSNVSLRVRQIF